MDKLLCILTISGGHYHFRTTQEQWEKLTAGAKVWFGNMVSGWELNGHQVDQIIFQYPLVRDQFVRVPVVHEARDRTPRDHPDYFIIYAPTDKPEAIK